MICPECRSEYREGVDRCATCDVPLVSAADTVPTPAPRNVIDVEDWKAVFRHPQVKVVALAVIAGHAVAAAIGSFIGAIMNSAGLLFRGNLSYGGGDWASAVRFTLFNLSMNLILWALTAGGAVIILARVIRRADPD